MLQSFYSKMESWFFSDEYKNQLKNEEQLKKELETFLQRFTLDFLENMQIDDYITGKEEKNTFCYFLEGNLEGYGTIGGQTTDPQQYGIHWDKKRGDYSFGGKKVKKTKFGHNKDEIFSNIKEELKALITATINNNEDEIIRNRLSPQFKNKVSFLYSNNTQVPIYSNDHLNIIFSLLQIPFSVTEDPFIKRKQLYGFYIESGLNKKMSPLMFMNFFYSKQGYRDLLKDSKTFSLMRDKTKKRKKITLIDIELSDENKIDIGIKEKPKREGLHNPFAEEKKRITGKKAEQIVIDYLKDHKKEFGIIGEIKEWCNSNDFKGYDISYEETGGKEIYIEVKGVAANVGNRIQFEMSYNERKVMKDNADHYYIFFVNDVFNAPKIKRILAKEINDDCYKPSKFSVSVKIKPHE